MASEFKILLWPAVAMIFCGNGSTLMKETEKQKRTWKHKTSRGAGSGSIKNLTASTSLNLTSQYSTIMISLRDAGMITIVKRLIQSRSNVIRVRVEPKSHHRRKKRSVCSLLAMLSSLRSRLYSFYNHRGYRNSTVA